MAEGEKNSDVVFEINITVTRNGAIEVKGPTDNFMLFRDIMNNAERAVMNAMAAEVMKKTEKQIITRNTVLAGRN